MKCSQSSEIVSNDYTRANNIEIEHRLDKYVSNEYFGRIISHTRI